MRTQEGALDALVRVCATATTDSALAAGAGALQNLAFGAGHASEITCTAGSLKALVRVCAIGKGDAALD